MKTNRTTIWLLLALFFVPVAPSAWGAELHGVAMPDTVTVEGKTLVLNGMGVRTKLVFKVYVGALYLERKATDAGAILGSEQVRRVVLHFVYDKVPREKLREAWADGFRANLGERAKALAPRIERFQGWMTDVVKGDEIEIVTLPGVGTKVKIKGNEAGLIEGRDFADALLSIWLGPKPIQEGLKKGMLGL